MILLYTDFGWSGPYVGQMKAVLASEAPGQPVVDLMHDAPAFAPGAAGRLLKAILRDVPTGGSVTVLGVVDPGVGTARRPIVVEADGRRFVGPDNGLFAPVLAAADPATRAAWQITLAPARLSASFHGRDLFAPTAARLARGDDVPGEPVDPAGLVGAEDGAARADGGATGEAIVLYVDGYGNAMLDLAAADLDTPATLAVGEQPLPRARTFGEVPEGTAFWYENALGLVEIAVNRGSAAAALGLEPGAPVRVAEGGRGRAAPPQTGPASGA